MATVGRSRPVKRVSPMKPGLTGARNWATAQIRAASYSRRGFYRLCFSVFCFVSAIVLGALWLGGFLPDAKLATQNFTKARLMSMGFVVEQVDVMGEGRLRETDIRAALGVQEGDFLFSLDIDAAQERIESISWVDRAVIRRLWPDRIVVQVIERRPYALWQNNGEFRLVDMEGVSLTDADPVKYSEMKLIVGPEAPQNISGFNEILARFPSIETRVDAMVQLPSGRWDIYINDQALKIQLPEDRPDKALATLIDLHATRQILDRPIAVLDLRLPDRVTILPLSASHA